MHNSVNDPIFRCMLSYTKYQQLHHECHLMTFGVQVSFLVYWHVYVHYAMRCVLMSYKRLQHG